VRYQCIIKIYEVVNDQAPQTFGSSSSSGDFVLFQPLHNIAEQLKSIDTML